MSDSETIQTEPKPTLTARLLCPSTILAVVLLGLTCLPMASCQNSDEDIVPALMAFRMAGFHEDQPQSAVDRVSRFVGSIPLLFMFTWPYWSSLPPVMAQLVLLRTRRGANICWRILILAFSIALFVFAFYLDFPYGWSVGVCSGAAIVVWIRSSPLLMSIWNRVRRVGEQESQSAKRNAIRGGFLSFALICLTCMFHFVWMRPSILIGGKLAAMTNLMMVLVALASARQSANDCEQWPRYGIRDLLVASVGIAIALWWFWA